MNCTQCGVEVQPGAKFCHECGTVVAGGDADANSPRKKLAGGMLREGDGSDAEQILWQGTYSHRAMFGAWIAAAIASLAAVIAGMLGAFSGGAWLLVLGLLGLLWLGLLARLLYHQFGTHYYLTNQRFIHEKGLLWREIDRIETIDIDDVTCHQGPVERMLGVGNITLKTSDQSTPEFTVSGIEDVREIASLLDDARRKERRKRGLYVESV